MIYLSTTERLGNQMFQYAFARAMLDKNPELEGICILYRGKFDNKNWWGNELNNFILESGNAWECNRKYKNNFMLLIYRILRKTILQLFPKQIDKFDEYIENRQRFFNKYRLYIPRGNSKKIKNFDQPCTKDIWILGNSGTEIPEYFNDIRNELIHDFTMKKELDFQCKQFLYQINKNKSVCVSIRKGDFLEIKNKKFDICSNKYYYSAIKLFEEKVIGSVFYIFSDDIEWVKNNMDFSGSKVIYEINNGDNSTGVKLTLMKSCKHFIISNSTFSWWCAFLGYDENRIIIAPLPWRKDENCDYFYDEHYILLDASSGEYVCRGDNLK